MQSFRFVPKTVLLLGAEGDGKLITDYYWLLTLLTDYYWLLLCTSKSSNQPNE